jgi:hypothetical protein
MPRIQGLQIKKKDTGRLDRTQASLPGVSAAPRHLISGACGKDGCLGTSSPGSRNPNRPETKLPHQKKTKCMEGDNHIYQSKQDGKHGWNNVRVVRFKSPFLNLWSGPTGDSGITSSTENQFTRENENTSCSYFRCIFCRWWLQQHVSTVLAAGVPKSRMTNVQSPEQVLSTASSVRLGDDSYAERCIVVVVSCN